MLSVCFPRSPVGRCVCVCVCVCVISGLCVREQKEQKETDREKRKKTETVFEKRLLSSSTSPSRCIQSYL